MEMEPTERDSDVGDDSPFQPPRWPSHPLLEAYRSATPQNGGSIPHRVPLLASCHVEAIIGNGHTNGEDSNNDDQSAPSPRTESSFQQSITPTRNQSTYQQSSTGSPSFRGINGVAERVGHLAIRRPSSPERPNENDDDSDEDEDSEEARKLAEEQLDVMARLQMQVRGIRVPEHFDANSIIASLQQRPFDYPIPNAVNFGQLAQQQAGTSSAPPHLPSALTSTSSHAGMPATQNGQNGQTGPDNSPRSSDGGSGNSANFAYEEQFRQLYEIDSNPVRREFLDDLFTYMHKRGTPINRLPIMAKHVLDLFQLYNLVVERGGLVEVINKKLWQEIIKGLNLPSSITSAAFTLRTQYMKYLYNYETEKKKFSTFSELQVAIDGNRREGRRATYYDHRATSSNPPTPQQQLTNARLSQLANSAMNLHNGHGIQAPPMPNPQMNGTAVLQAAIGNELQQSINMMDYFKMFQNVSMPTSVAAAMPTPGGLNVAATLWNSVYNNNPNQHQPPQIHHQIPEQREPINLANPDTNNDSFADTTPNSSRRKRSRRSPYDRSDNSNDSATAARRRRSPSVSPPPAQRPAPFATSIRIETRGDARNGEGSLVVTMEVGGQTYQGVLFSQQNESGESRNSPRNSMP